MGLIYEDKNPNLDLDTFSGFHLSEDGAEAFEKIMELSNETFTKGKDDKSDRLNYEEGERER